MGEWKRRSVLAGIAGSSVAGIEALAQLGDSNEQVLSGGTMALSQAYNVAGDLWIGPDSAKSSVNAKSGRLYWSTDYQVQYYGDSGNWQLMGLGSSQQAVPDIEVELVSTDEQRTKTNLSMRRPLDHVYQGHVVADDGTHYALHHDGDLVLSKGPTPQQLTEKHRWTTSDNTKRTIHFTQNGTLLVGGVGANLYRSTDGGSSFTNVETFNSSVWAISQNSNGDLVLATSGESVEVQQSTDDGASWSLIADGTTLSEFGRHAHRVRYIPNSNYIVVTGGDSGTTGFYRSTDNGSTWDYYNPLSVQYVGICGHPNDGNTYFLAGDDVTYGPVVKISDDGTSISATPVHYPVLEDNPPNNDGSFAISALQQSDGTGGYILAGAGDSQPHIFVSDSLKGESWRSLGPVDKGTYTYIYDQGKGQGPYETTVDVSAVESVILGGTHVYTSPALDHHYGTHDERGVDQRPAHGDITMPEFASLRFAKKVLNADIVDPIEVDPSDGNRTGVRVKNGKWNFRDFTAGNDVFRLDLQSGDVNMRGSPLLNPRLLNNAGGADLTVGEWFLDENSDGAGTFSIGYYDSSGTIQYWDVDRTE